MIKQGDCLELMKEIPDGAVDAIICDPPYGITNCAFDVRLPFEPMWEQFKRVTKKNAAICLFSQMPFGAELIMSNRKMFRYEWIWEKSLGVGFLNAKKMPLRCHENILVFYRALPTYNPQWRQGRKREKTWINILSKNYATRDDKPWSNDGEHYYPRDVIYGKSTMGGAVQPILHPQQKPTALLEYLIKTYTNEGEVVLDATMGSGSTGVACVNTGRKFIGFEKEQNFFEIAEKRIDEAASARAQELF